MAGGCAWFAVHSPYSGEAFDTVPEASAEDVDAAVRAAVEGARTMADLPAHERATILERFADVVDANLEEVAMTITKESGKPLSEATAEAAKTAPGLRLCAHEALRLTGEVLPMDSVSAGEGRLGLTMVEPCGVVAAITPFNFPARLVALKLGPALAAGNAVVIKPASTTPLSALLLVRYALEGGVPPLAIQCFCGPGSTVGEALCADKRVRLITFTGSYEVARQITRVAGPKRLTLELGSTQRSSFSTTPDVEASAVASACDGYVNAGQVCIAAQRVIVERRSKDAYLEALLPRVDALQVGNPLDYRLRLDPSSPSRRGQNRRVDRRGSGSWGVRPARRRSRWGAVEPTVVINPPMDSLPGERNSLALLSRCISSTARTRR